ncbi:unnamed protein product [Brachionus calyciflorus]|uniref:Uncharacterized protein n=1 Tax=Brachionus calyciflorus TaxID=104777 RepID=A0A813T6S9_9BILA|nr:unnamed protein product [Brachionus calyciflorus]
MAIIYEKIILKRINKKYQGIKNQFGFRTNSSCRHAVFAFKESVLFNRRQKKRKIGATIDASKAFDKLNRVNLGVKQRGPLSPLLFAIYIEQLSALLDTDPGGIIIGEIKINNILYAYDLLLFTEKKTTQDGKKCLNEKKNRPKWMV